MTEQEKKVLNRIPKKYRRRIVNLTIRKVEAEWDKLGDFYPAHNDYTLEWDNGVKVTFCNQAMMIFLLKEYTEDNGYYYGA